MDGEIKSKRLRRSTFCKRDILSNHDKHKPCQTCMVAGDVEFWLLKMRDLNKVRSKLEIMINRRIRGTCQHKYVLQSLQKSFRRDISAVLLNITLLLVRLAQTITMIY